MAERTFGWVQDSGSIGGLKDVLRAMVPESEFNRYLREEKIPRFVPERFGREELIRAITGENCALVPYRLLKGRGITCQLTARENMEMFGYGALAAESLVKKGGRGNTACSGIVQISVSGQKNLPDGTKRPYQADWPAECFLRWAISIGLMDYDQETDSCALAGPGRRFVDSADGSKEEREILGEAYLSYPPAVRVLRLLDEGGHLTKFEIGGRLGFTGEAGFTSIPQNMFVSGCCSADSPAERAQIRANTEGSSDKYARMTASWLCDIGWVKASPKEVRERFAGREYGMKIGQAYSITLEGRRNLKRAVGSSKMKRIPKIVFWDMLATKAFDKDYLRNRRACMIRFLGRERTIPEIVAHLGKKGFEEGEDAVIDDLSNFSNIGLNVTEISGGRYKISDEIIKLELPAAHFSAGKSGLTETKDRLRERLKHLDHKYLALLDLAWDGGAGREFEIYTMDLLTNELAFEGMHLGGSSKPDGVFYWEKTGVIVDTKAYSRGYSLPRSQADEMIRYIEENKARGQINKNCWWERFAPGVTKFHYLFVSSQFISGFRDRLEYIGKRTGVTGGAVSAENLLLLAEALKSGEMTRGEWFACLDRNEEVAAR